VAEEEVVQCRLQFEKAAIRLTEIRALGYPELRWKGSLRSTSIENIPTISVDDLQIFQPLECCELLGEGALAHVYQVELPVRGLVAFKRFKKGVNLNAMRKEAAAIFKLRHPNIVRLMAICLDKGYEGLVMELVTRGSLAHRIYCDPPHCFGKQDALLILKEVLVALRFIHDQNHLHLDIKAANVLLIDEKRHKIKLSDFGTAQEMSQTINLMMTKVPEMTLRWAAPERMQLGHKLRPSADIYSIGMLLYEMLTGKMPFSDMDIMQLMTILSSDAIKPTLSGEKLDPFCVSLMNQCWSKRASKRPSAKQLLINISEELCRSCLVCFEDLAVSRGVECSNAEGNHFVCGECLQDQMSIHVKSDDNTVVPEEGHVRCLDQACVGIIGVDSLKTCIDKEMLLQWTEVAGKRNFEQEKVRYEKQIRELKDAAQYGPVMKHVHKITEQILVDACPRCGLVFMDFTGCFALKCGSKAGCTCHFCGWCLKDCGSNAHDHVRRCRLKHRDNHQNYYGTREQFEQVRQTRQLEALRGYILDIDDVTLRKQVLDKLKPHVRQFPKHEINSWCN